MKFYNPYFFLPVTKGLADDDERTVPYKSISRGETPYIRHDFYHPDYHSGEITCTLTTETPTFVGNQQKSGKGSGRSAVAQHYKVNGVHAFPANSLNGMIGSITEALSQSSLRILQNLPLSLQKKRKKPFDYPDSHTAFNSLVTPDNLFPWNSDRKNLTPAEYMFGIVEETTEDKPGRNLASRIRFSDALPATKEEVTLSGEKTLRILSSPKPPSPDLYFHKRKKNNNNSTLTPNGRKYYLHHRSKETDDKLNYYATRDKDNSDTIEQKIRCRPIAAEQPFEFTVCFHNLSKGEMGLLLIALEPDTKFMHRLGLGKPLGLGSVKLQVQSVCLDKPEENYTGFNEQCELEELDENRISELRKAALQGEEPLIDVEVLDVLCILGDREKLQLPVLYPCTTQQYKDFEGKKATGERELFKWSVNNKNTKPPQKLCPENFGDNAFRISQIALKTNSKGKHGKRNKSKP